MDTMLSKALREFTTGPLNQLIVNIGGQDGLQWEEELKKFLRKEPCWIPSQGVMEVKAVAKAVTAALLVMVGTVVIPATTEKFVAKEKFMISTKHSALVKIRYIGDNFKAWFLNGEGKTEEPITEQTFSYHKLRKSSMDGPINAELGGKAEAETTLAGMFSFMEKQKNGEDGVLLNNGYANIFYIKDSAGVLRTVHVYWNDDGWYVAAYEVSGPCRWDVGSQVFSRNSVLESLETSVPAQA